MPKNAHLTSRNVVARNDLRAVFVAPREKGGLPKGNRDSTYLGSNRPTPDETARWGDVRPFSNEVREYFPTPKAEPKVWNGRVSGEKSALKVKPVGRLRNESVGCAPKTGKVSKVKRVSVADAPKPGRRGVPGSRFR